MKGGVEKKLKEPDRNTVLFVVNSLQCFKPWTLHLLTEVDKEIRR